MKSLVIYFCVGILLVFLQSSVFPLFLPPNLRPSLMLILVLYAGLSENGSRALLIGLLLGAVQDSFSGHSLGLYVSVNLVIVLSVRVLSEQLNVESTPLLMLLVAGGTLLQNFLVGLLLAILANVEPVLHILLPAIPQQLLANLVFAGVVLLISLKLQALFGHRRGLAGLIYQSRHHGS
ncbi:MAG: rod shape-determining protein MreD [Desulfuromonadales bacterium]|nr:rod shape-determining protein MreD [Desulfuromonadales bacterium]MBN2791148.1 rod shape-determining protein MreD [Desulfuromonadales bacterium]